MAPPYNDDVSKSLPIVATPANWAENEIDDDSKVERIIASPVNGGADLPVLKGCLMCLFEVYEVKILRCGSGVEKTAEIYGKIELSCPRGFWDLFDRPKENPEIVTLPGPITLQTPPLGIQAYDPSGVRLRLEGTLSEVDETILWWFENHTWNEVVRFTIEREHCTLELSFIGISRAVLADVEVTLVNDDLNKPIYGKITLLYTMKMKGFTSFILFNRKEEECVVVNEKEVAISLSRSVVSAPRDSGLVVDVNLKTSSGEEIVTGIVQCEPPSHFGEFVGILGKGCKNQVRVKFTLCPYREHVQTRQGLKRTESHWGWD